MFMTSEELACFGFTLKSYTVGLFSIIFVNEATLFEMQVFVASEEREQGSAWLGNVEK